MFGRYTVRLAPGVKAMVKGRIQTQSPLTVGRDDEVYFVSSVPCVKSISGKAACREGIVHSLTLQVRFSLPQTEAELQAIASTEGDSTPGSQIRTITAEERMSRAQIDSHLSAAIHTHIQGQSFFALLRPENVISGLQPRLQELCAKERIIATIEACTEITYVSPTEIQLAELAVRSGRSETADASGVSTVTYSDLELGRVVEYFDQASRERASRELEALRQKKLNEVEVERTTAEAGPQLEKLRQDTARAVTETKIEEQNQAHRLEEHSQELKKKSQEWEMAAHKRNADIMEIKERYEAEFKTRRQNEELALRKQKEEEEIALQTRQLEAEQQLTAMRAEVADAARCQKQLDEEMEIKRERVLSDIRVQEMVGLAEQYASVLDRVRVPIPNYSGVQTLIIGPDGNKSGEMLTALLVDLLNRFGQGFTVHSGALVRSTDGQSGPAD